MPDEAVIVVLPVATPCAKPLVVIVATAVLDDVHVTEEVTSLVVPSLNVPTAENCCVGWLDRLMEGFCGEIAIEFKGELTTLTVVEPVIPAEVAEMVADPVAIAVASPVLLIVTICRFEEVQVISEGVLVWPLSKLPEAENCWVPPFKSEGLGGETVIEVNFGSTKKPLQDEASAKKNTAQPSRTQDFRPLSTICISMIRCNLRQRKRWLNPTSIVLGRYESLPADARNAYLIKDRF